MNKDNLAQKIDPAGESWREVLRDICEVARNSLHNLVSSGTPPLPRCYQQEFLQAANLLTSKGYLKSSRVTKTCWQSLSVPQS